MTRAVGKLHKNAGMFGVLLTSCSMFTGDFGAAEEGGQIVGLLKDCLQSLLGIVEEEKRRPKVA